MCHFCAASVNKFNRKNSDVCQTVKLTPLIETKLDTSDDQTNWALEFYKKFAYKYYDQNKMKQTKHVIFKEMCKTVLK